MLENLKNKCMQKWFWVMAAFLFTYTLILFLIFVQDDLKQWSQPLKYGTIEITDLSGCAAYDCKIDAEGNVVFEGTDPFVILNNVNININYIEVEYDTEYTGCSVLKIYYDTGNGFGEGDTAQASLDSKNGTVWIPIKEDIENVRLDFEACTKGSQVCFKINELTINPNVSHKIFETFLWMILTAFLAYIASLAAYIYSDGKGWIWIIKWILTAILQGVFAIVYCAQYTALIKLIIAAAQILLTLVICLADGKKQKYCRYAFIGSAFLVYLVWAILIPYGQAPDESMRYQITEFIYQHGYIPEGGDPRIRHASYGISYAFVPIIAYVIEAVLVKFTSLFTKDFDVLLMSARIVSVFFSMGTLVFILKIGKKLFKKESGWLFAAAIAFLPQFTFISGYVNCDSMALFAVSWIIYALICGPEKKWDLRSCMFLGSGIGVCMLSYYNTYGVILVAVLFCIFSVLTDKEIKENKGIFLLKRTLWTMMPALLIAGWWFVRNYFIYDGDITGLIYGNTYAEKYAIDALKPSNRATPYNQGVSWKYMLFDMEWLASSMRSYFGVFGNMSIAVDMNYYWCYWIIALCGMCGNFVPDKNKNKDRQSVFSVFMLLMCLISIGISLYYSYYSDYQPQGRYCFPMLIPMSYLSVKGWDRILALLPDKFGRVVSYLLAFLMPAVCAYILFTVIFPLYA